MTLVANRVARNRLRIALRPGLSAFGFSCIFGLYAASVVAATNVTFTVSADTDDADEVSGGTVYVTDGSSFLSGHVGFRFQNVTIPTGATVTSATLEVFSNSSGSTSFSVDLTAQDADSAPTFVATNGNITGRTLTSAQTVWNTGSTSYSVGQSITSPNFASSIQEVIDRAGWSSGNSLVVVTTPNSGNKGIFKRSGAPSYAPKLHVTYTTGGTIYHVRTDGSDSNTGTGSSASEAWATITYAATAAGSPGDVVYVRAGTYVGQISPTGDGTSLSPIQFIADTDGSIFGMGGDVILRATEENHALNIQGDDYLQFIGFKIQGDNDESDAVEVDALGFVLEKCEIYDGGAAGVDINGGTVTLKNCLIHNNSGDGISMSTGTLTIWNSTIAYNSSDGIEQHSGTVTITNSIFALNSSDGLDLNSGTMTHTYNLVYGSGSSDYEGTSASTGEISVDPLFMSASNFRLECNSPAIDVGTNAAGTVDDDLAGVARPNGSGWDLGCYEGSGLMIHWKLDDGSGATLADSSIYGNDASFNTGTPTWISGVRGGALEFDGTNDAVTGANFTPPQAGTVAFWMKVPGSPGSHGRILGLHDTWEVRHVTTGTSDGIPYGLVFDLGVSGVNTEFVTTTTIDTPEKWYHIAASYDTTNDSYQVYINGVLHKSGTYPSALSLPAANLCSIGNRTGSSNYFTGSLDDVRIYCYALSATEVAELYGLVGHWKMDEGTGTTVADSTAFANDATLNGASWRTDCTGTYSLEFDGVADTATTNASFDPPETGVVAFWLRSAGNPGARSRPFGVGGDWEMRQETDGRLSFDLGAEGPDEGSGPDEFVTTDGLSFQDRWYHVIAQFDASDDSFEVYIDGALVHSGTNGDDMVEQLADTLTFGSRTGSSDFWEGGMRDFRVYNRWLTGDEISELSGLVAYWKLDEISGTVASDSSPNGHDGTLAGNPTWTTAGNIDGALDFETDDGDDRVDVGAFDVTGSEISISAWVRPENGTNDGRIVIKSFGNSGSQQYWGMAVGSSMELDFRVTAGGTFDFFTENNVLLPGKWNHVAGTYDGTTMRMYVNGVEVGSNVHTVGGALNTDATAAITLGDSPVGGRAYDGRIDDVRVLSRVMCSEEVFNTYKGGRPAGIRIIKWVEVR